MTYIEAVENITKYADRRARRRSWECEEDEEHRMVSIKNVADATTARGSFGVTIKPFLAISNTETFGMEVYYPTDEDITAFDWYIL